LGVISKCLWSLHSLYKMLTLYVCFSQCLRCRVFKCIVYILTSAFGMWCIQHMNIFIIHVILRQCIHFCIFHRFSYKVVLYFFTTHLPFCYAFRRFDVLCKLAWKDRMVTEIMVIKYGNISVVIVDGVYIYHGCNKSGLCRVRQVRSPGTVGLQVRVLDTFLSNDNVMTQDSQLPN
jgi:hypothetical protein